MLQSNSKSRMKFATKQQQHKFLLLDNLQLVTQRYSLERLDYTDEKNRDKKAKGYGASAGKL